MSERHQAGILMAEGRPGRRDVLASDADRDAAAEDLSSAFAEGRLTVSEHGERVEAVYAARTVGELAELTADLPATRSAAGREAPTVHREVDRCLLCALLVLCPPAGIAWLLATSRRARAARRAAPSEEAAIPRAAGRAGQAPPTARMPRLGGSGAEDR